MKILIYSMNFSPEIAGIGKFSGEMAAWLNKRGHEIRVISAQPSFPDWKVFQGHRAAVYSKGVVNGITVFRTPTWIPTKPRAATRLLHLFSFMLSSMPALFAQILWRPDLIFVVEPPLACSPAALLFSKLSGCKCWLHVQDYEVDAAFDMGMLTGRRSRRFVGMVETFLLQSFSRVSTISTKMIELAIKKGTAPEKLLLFPNWVDTHMIFPLERVSVFRKLLNIPREAIVVLYSGSMGQKQGLGVVAEVTHKLAAEQNIHFVFCGNGPSKIEFAENCSHSGNVHFLGLQPLDKLNELLGVADIHILPQRVEAADIVMPSKLTGMLASGKAVLVTAHAETELGVVVAKCGIVVPPGEAGLLADAIQSLATSHAMRTNLGKVGRLYAEREMQLDPILARVEGEMIKCVAE